MPTMAAARYITEETACGERYDYALMSDRLSDSIDIRADYHSGHYFDPATLRWFGSSHFATVAPGASVELQRNAPDGVPQYRVQLWRVGDDGSPEPWFGCRHDSRREAVACARESAASLA